MMPAPRWAHPSLLAPAACWLYFLLLHRSPGYALGGALVLAALAFAFARWERVASGSLAPVLLGIAAVALPALGAWQFLQLGDIGDVDHASYACGLWNLGHGNPHYGFLGRNMLGIHSQYTAYFWIPVQAIGGELALKFGNGLCLLAAAVLLIRRHRDQWRLAAWGALALLVAPAVASQFFFGFHPEMVAAPLLVLAFGAYREKRLVLFLLLAIALAATRETLTLAVGGILLAALAERRDWKWIILPGVACCAVMAVYWYLIMPRFAGSDGNDLAFFFPSSPGEILALWSRPQTLRYLLHIYVPMLPLLLALPRRYLLLPLPTMAFYAAFPDPLFVQMWPNYAYPLILLCLAGLWMEPGLRLGMPAAARGVPGRVLDARVLAACAAACLLCYPLWREIMSVPATGLDRNRAVADIRERVGDRSAVLVHGNLAARFAARRDIGLLGLQPRPAGAFDFVVLDSAFVPPWPVDEKAVAAAKADVADTSAWAAEYSSAGITLFRRKAGLAP